MEEKINEYIGKVEILTVKFDNVLEKLEGVIVEIRASDKKFVSRESFDLVILGLTEKADRALERGRSARNWGIGVATTIGVSLFLGGANYIIQLLTS